MATINIYYRKKGEQYLFVYPARDEEEAQRVVIGLLAQGYEVIR